MLLSPLRSALASAVRSPLEAGRRVLALFNNAPFVWRDSRIWRDSNIWRD